LTRRMLLLLESACIGRSDAYRRVVNNVLRRYIREDYGWMHSRNPNDVPRFLQNDMARYWRTLAVDFAYKRRQRAGRGWGLRTAKLRLSRKLTYASGLLMCFDGALNSTQGDVSAEVKSESAALEIVERLSNLVDLTPLALFAKLFLEQGGFEIAAAKMFGAYDQFLSILDDNDQRGHLNNISQPDIAADETYQRVRALGHDFQAALNAVFIDRQTCPKLHELTMTYGIF
jgi:hypothetical protein